MEWNSRQSLYRELLEFWNGYQNSWIKENAYCPCGLQYLICCLEVVEVLQAHIEKFPSLYIEDYKLEANLRHQIPPNMHALC